MSDTLMENDIDPNLREQSLRDAKQMIAGSTPLMGAIPDSRVVLARGLHQNGIWETEAIVRELTGQDEENLSRFTETDSFLDAVIVYGTERVGSIHLTDKDFSDRQGLLRGLLVGERSQLFLAICRVSFGDVKTLSYTCGTCNQESDVDITLSTDIKIPEMKNPQQSTYEYLTTKGESIEFTLVTGWEQYEVAQRKLGMAEQNTLLLSKLITSVGNQPVVDPLSYARNLSMRDRRAMIEELIAHQPNPDTELKVQCANCEATIDLSLTWELVFRS